MDGFSIELMGINESQSLVLLVNGELKEFVVCSYYDSSKPLGSQWDWGHYFKRLEDAMEYIRKECFRGW